MSLSFIRHLKGFHMWLIQWWHRNVKPIRTLTKLLLFIDRNCRWCENCTAWCWSLFAHLKVRLGTGTPFIQSIKIKTWEDKCKDRSFHAGWIRPNPTMRTKVWQKCGVYLPWLQSVCLHLKILCRTILINLNFYHVLDRYKLILSFELYIITSAHIWLSINSAY